MKKISLFFFSLFFGLNAFTQDIDKAMDYFKREKYDSAAIEFEAALPLLEKKYGPTDTAYYMKQVLFTARAFDKSAQNKKAEQYYIQVKSIYESINATVDTGYASTLNYLGTIYYFMEKYKDALPLFVEAVSIRHKLLGSKHHSYAASLNNLALLYSDMGNYEAALPLFKEAKSIQQEVLGAKHPDYILSLQNLAMLYMDMGNYEAALPLFEEAKKISQEVLGAKDPDYAMSLNNLGSIYCKMGNYQAALPLYEEAASIDKEAFGAKHQYYATDLNNLALLYSDMGNYEASLPLHKEASAIFKEILGAKKPAYATSINNLATLYVRMGNYEAALPFYEEALAIYKEILGPKHPNYAKSLNSMAALYFKLGNYETALPLFEEAKSIRREVLGTRHPDYAISLTNLARLYLAMQNYASALPLFEEANTIINQNIQDNFSFISKVEKEKYLIMVGNNYEIYLSFLKKIYSTFPEFCTYGYDDELLLKGLIHTSVTAMQQAILESGDTSLTGRYEQMRVLKRQITSQQQKPISKRRRDLAELEQQANDLERELTRHSHVFGDLQASFQIKWKDVQKKISSNEAVIEFISFHYYNERKFTDSTLYCALVLRKTDTLPRMVYLCEESALKKAIPLLSATFKDINLLYHGQTLYGLVWHPIDSLLGGISTVYFAPSGLLNSISMAAISCPNNKALMEKYSLVQLSSTRTLALSGKPESIINAVVYGGIVYDADTLTLLTKAEKYNKKESGLLAYNRSSTGVNRSGFRYLPGTLKEADLISAKLVKNGVPTTTYSGTDALEESFIALSGNASPSVIHLSTHGFYYPDTISDKNRKNITYSSTGEVQFRYSDDPLLRSGLLMAGANLAWKGLTLPPNVEDGILTAKEVSNMNLMNTQLVVLSACQTGLGDVKGSEGVEGLQRGFKMAGARYIMMSLWDVPDKETTEFMTSFYDNWLGGKDIRDAFLTTQVTMKNKYKNEPYKWAAFVLTE